MLDLLYRTGIHQVLLPTRPPDLGKPTFKWIHFPANNRQWVNDLFTGLGLQDNSMENQQRDSSKIPFKYLFPKAEGYVQYKTTMIHTNGQVLRHSTRLLHRGSPRTRRVRWLCLCLFWDTRRRGI
ncbi:hypothetical protein BJY00DRAFT_297521 [Aspergillus carlsbadensis]|nr:hypothetical protein BJY00DRAFT_297521 [Aspergillus carlsbadensis]